MWRGDEKKDLFPRPLCLRVVVGFGVGVVLGADETKMAVLSPFSGPFLLCVF